MGARATRRQLLLGGAGAAVAGTLIPGPVRAAAQADGLTDADRLRRLLSVELLMLYCYENVLSSSLLVPRARRLIGAMPGQEEAHMRVLKARLQALGGQVPSPPASPAQANRDLARRGVGGRLGQLQGSRDALFLLLAVEQVVVGAYFVALAKLSDDRLIRLAAEIMANEAQHEALVGVAIDTGDVQEAVPYGLVQGVQ